MDFGLLGGWPAGGPAPAPPTSLAAAPGAVVSPDAAPGAASGDAFVEFMADLAIAMGGTVEETAPSSAPPARVVAAPQLFQLTERTAGTDPGATEPAPVRLGPPILQDPLGAAVQLTITPAAIGKVRAEPEDRTLPAADTEDAAEETGSAVIVNAAPPALVLEVPREAPLATPETAAEADQTYRPTVPETRQASSHSPVHEPFVDVLQPTTPAEPIVRMNPVVDVLQPTTPAETIVRTNTPAAAEDTPSEPSLRSEPRAQALRVAPHTTADVPPSTSTPSRTIAAKSDANGTPEVLAPHSLGPVASVARPDRSPSLPVREPATLEASHAAIPLTSPADSDSRREGGDAHPERQARVLDTVRPLIDPRPRVAGSVAPADTADIASRGPQIVSIRAHGAEPIQHVFRVVPDTTAPVPTPAGANPVVPMITVPPLASPVLQVLRANVPSQATSSDLPDTAAPQIVQSIRLAWTRSSGEARITLDPAKFGDLAVEMRVSRGEVIARLSSDSPVVREWIQNNQDVLRAGLAEHQLRLDRLEVRASRSPEDAPAQDDRHHRESDPQPQRRRKSQTGEFFDIVA